MRRPRLTERTAEALEIAIMWLDDCQPEGRREKMKRAITYLEDLLRWHRARQSLPPSGQR